MKLLLAVIFVLFAGLSFCTVYADDVLFDNAEVNRIKRQAQGGDDAERVGKLRAYLNVYPFTSTDYPAIFAIIAGISTILAIAVLFIGVGIWNMDPGKDSIIYRMTTTRMKKD